MNASSTLPRISTQAATGFIDNVRPGLDLVHAKEELAKMLENVGQDLPYAPSWVVISEEEYNQCTFIGLGDDVIVAVRAGVAVAVCVKRTEAKVKTRHGKNKTSDDVASRLRRVRLRQLSNQDFDY